MTSSIDDSNDLYDTHSHQVTVEEVLEAMGFINIIQDKALVDRMKTIEAPSDKLIEKLEASMPRSIKQFRDACVGAGKPFPLDIEGNPLDNDNAVNPEKNVCGEVINPDTGLPYINWDAHKSFDPSL